MGTSTHLIVLKELYGNPATHLNTIQSWLAPHADILTMLWISIWCATALAVALVGVREFLHERDI